MVGEKNDVRSEWDADRMTSVTMAFDFVASSDDGLGLGEAVGALALGLGVGG